jgi:hypothetical protein
MPLIIYDNGGKTSDRYTAIDTRQIERAAPGGILYAAIGFNDQPFQSVGMHTSAMRGRHLGKKITIDQLNEDCKKFVHSYLSEGELCLH